MKSLRILKIFLYQTKSQNTSEIDEDHESSSMSRYWALDVQMSVVCLFVIPLSQPPDHLESWTLKNKLTKLEDVLVKINIWNYFFVHSDKLKHEHVGSADKVCHNCPFINPVYFYGSLCKFLLVYVSLNHGLAMVFDAGS